MSPLPSAYFHWDHDRSTDEALASRRSRYPPGGMRVWSFESVPRHTTVAGCVEPRAGSRIASARRHEASASDTRPSAF